MLKNLFRFGKSRDGLAAVEFGFIAPVMVTLFFGTMELADALSCRTDVSSVASTAGDLVAQESTITTADLSNVYNAATAILYPYYPNFSQTKPTIRITSIIDAGSTGSGTIQWTCTQAGSGTLKPASRSVGDTVTLPQPIMTSGNSIIMAEVSYGYASPVSKMIVGTPNMTNVFYTRPRQVAQIPGPTSCP
jgi:Flp pilus assembly protein TadG